MKKKKLSLGLILTFLFDAFGIIYASFAGFLFFLITGILIGFLIGMITDPVNVLPSGVDIVNHSNGLVSGKIRNAKLDYNSPRILLFWVSALIYKFTAMNFTYTVIKEKNRRIDLNLPKMTGWEEIDLGLVDMLRLFINSTYIFVYILIPLFFSCVVYALASFFLVFERATEQFQMIFFFSTFGIFMILLAIYWLKNRNVKNSDF